MKSRVGLVPILFLIFVTLWLRLVNLGYSDYQGDESKALWLLKPGQNIIGFLFSKNKGPGEYLVTYLTHFINPTFQNEFLARLPFALAGITAIFFFYRLVRLHYGKKIAVYAALFLSINGLFVGLMRIVQYQPFIILFSILTLYCFSLALQGEPWRYRGIYLGVFFWTAALFFHYDGVFIAPAAVYLLARWYIQNRGRPSAVSLRYLLAAFLGGAILLASYYVPLLYKMIAVSGMGYLQDRIVGLEAAQLLPSSIRNINLYNPILGIYIYVALCLLALTRPKRVVLPLAWFAITWFILEVIVNEPGTHIYNYVLPATILAAFGVEVLEQMVNRIAGETWGEVLNAVWIAVIFMALAAISHLIFVDHTPEYPFEKRRILFWTIGGIEPGYLLRIYGFPYYRNWEGIAEYLASQNSSENYVTNEDERLSRYYIPYKYNLIKAGYFIYIYNTQNIWERDLRAKELFWRKQHPPDQQFRFEGRLLADVYKMSPGTLQKLRQAHH